VRNKALIFLQLMAIFFVFVFAGACLAADAGEEVLTRNVMDGTIAISPEFSMENLLRILARLGLATLLGFAIACHPMRFIGSREIMGKKAVRTVKSQILITVAGALMVIIIGGSVARAFGLVGLGSFVRFRTTVKNQKELATMFLLVAVGMSCGLGIYAFAVIGAAFIIILLSILEIRKDILTSTVVLRLDVPDPIEDEPKARKVLEACGVSILKTKLNKKKSRLKYTLEKSDKLSMSELNKKLSEAKGLKSSALAWDEQPGAITED